MDYLINHYDDVLELFMQHMRITVLSVGIAFLIAFPIGLLISHYKKLSPVVNAVCNTIFSIPSLALLVLLIPITGLGTTTAVTALVLYNQYLLVKNISEGFNEISPAVKEIGLGMGMNKIQLFFAAELPLAMPLIISGLKVSVISTIAMATLASTVGAGGLGTLIFTGLTTRHWNKVIIGTVASALIASIFTTVLQVLENYFLSMASGRKNETKKKRG